ncbi:hypothetical protein IHV84_02785 [Acidovorax sp. IB03]|nr:hypothetical protein [Acidovorax sp. IB03]
MSSWYRLDLGNGADAFVPTRQIQEAFMNLLIAHGTPRSDWALFSRYDLRADNVELYFTPASAALALQFGASPCDKPTHNQFNLGLLCGEASGLLHHFPDHPRARD